jgi:glucan 1,3-beta-glucosidase
MMMLLLLLSTSIDPVESRYRHRYTRTDNRDDDNIKHISSSSSHHHSHTHPHQHHTQHCSKQHGTNTCHDDTTSSSHHELQPPPPLYGLNYHSPHNHISSCATYDQLHAEISTISQYTTHIRLYSVNECNQGQMILQLAKQYNITVALGFWLTTINQWHTNTSTVSFGIEKGYMLQLIDTDHTLFAHTVNSIIVGSETQMRHEIDANLLSAYVSDIQETLVYKHLPFIPVTVADSYNQWLLQDDTYSQHDGSTKKKKTTKHTHSNSDSDSDSDSENHGGSADSSQLRRYSSDHGIKRLIHTVDFLMIHIYPYYEQIPIDNAVDYVFQRVNELKKQLEEMNQSQRKIVIGETGWPSEGLPNGNAIPTPHNAYRYYREFICRARMEQIEYYYFEAHDESWKAQESLDLRYTESHFGLLNEGDRQPKYPFPKDLHVKC